MRIVVIGAGAVGGVLGGLLTEAGEDVALVRKNSEAIRLTREAGLKITMPSGAEKVIRVTITDSPNVMPKPDLILITVKSNDTQAAAEEIAGMVGPSTSVLSVQNGAGNVETIIDVLGSDENVWGATVAQSFTVIGPNHLSYAGGTNQAIKMGPVNGKVSKKISEVASLIQKIGFNVEISDRMQDVIWNKVIINSGNPIYALSGLNNVDIANCPEALGLLKQVVEEAARVAKAKGIFLTYSEDPAKPLFEALDNIKKNNIMSKASMLQDLEARRKTEIEAITGVIVEEGRKMGIPTPISSTLYALIKSVEYRFAQGY